MTIIDELRVMVAAERELDGNWGPDTAEKRCDKYAHLVTQLLDSNRVAAGGWDGIVLSYGEGADDDTVEATIGHYLPFVCQLTLRDGRCFDVTEGGFRRSDDGRLDNLELYYRETDEDSEPIGDVQAVPFSDVVGIVIY